MSGHSCRQTRMSAPPDAYNLSTSKRGTCHCLSLPDVDNKVRRLARRDEPWTAGACPGARIGSGATMRVQLRIVAGNLRGRKLLCDVNPDLRPTPQMVREALFSILGNA